MWASWCTGFAPINGTLHVMNIFSELPRGGTGYIFASASNVVDIRISGYALLRNLRVYGHNCITQQGHSAQSDLFWRLHFSATALYRGVSLFLGSIN